MLLITSEKRKQRLQKPSDYYLDEVDTLDDVDTDDDVDTELEVETLKRRKTDYLLKCNL